MALFSKFKERKYDEYSDDDNYIEEYEDYDIEPVELDLELYNHEDDGVVESKDSNGVVESNDDIGVLESNDDNGVVESKDDNNVAESDDDDPPETLKSIDNSTSIWNSLFTRYEQFIIFLIFSNHTFFCPSFYTIILIFINQIRIFIIFIILSFPSLISNTLF